MPPRENIQFWSYPTSFPFAAMEMYKVCFALVATTLAVFSSVAYADDFTNAYNKIERAKHNINYNSFCKEIARGGEEKLGCRIDGITSIGFLVCKKMKPDGVTPCLEVIENEVRNLVTIMQAGINTVDLSPKPNQRIITGVKCGEEKSGQCSGFLEKWVSRDIGEFQHIRDSIVANKVGQLIADVITYTTGDLKSTARDLVKIRDYMLQGKYFQVCDLQGFFLKKGGFKVNDVPAIKQIGLNETCFDGEPTTEEVLKALDWMIDAFKTHNLKINSEF